jgi:phage baseplate assembly protein W
MQAFSQQPAALVPTQYVGFAFPFQKGATGFPASASNNDLIQQALVQLVLTGRGERVMRPDVGSGAYSFVFQSTGAALQALIQRDVRNVIAKYEPRVIVQEVRVTTNDATLSHPTMVAITIKYIVVITQQTQSVTITMNGP